MLRLSDFDYSLPKELIAQYPLKERDTCRLLVLDRKKQEIRHLAFKDILDYLEAEDLLLLNDTRVLPCRLMGKRKSGGRVEILLLENKEGLNFQAMLKPARLKVGEEIIFGSGVTAEITGRDEVRFKGAGIEEVYSLGVMPLPPYIKREPEVSDNCDYQTVYAREEGAVASPTAGLHFTPGLIAKLEGAGVNLGYLTLHVGAGTFKPVKSEDITAHKMHPEYFKIPEGTLKLIAEAKNKGRRIFCVGTTSLRALETFAQGKSEGSTELFIYPGFKFKLTDSLLTNFHLPKTTLFMLVCAFAGEELAKKAYQEAIKLKYRFYSYGDAMLIL
ncbi:MAG TPA: tRNA preQ1(34) S-adenosylmethionine ribosyltransferase-isomerase QueA [Candidatus Margulisiibacteriota bacterium]|nr:tRNA preQ1(34) S-adenosylmethionine ribosyltransferase-isomerase QueA [Candidatus Margulisiibacteriota bacterium]